MNRMKLDDTIFPGDRVEIVRYRLTKTQNEVHCHDFAEIAWVEEGEGIHVINNRRVNIQKGDLLLIRPNDQHCYQLTNKSGFILLNIAIPSSTYQFFLKRYQEEAQNLWGQENAFPFQIKLNTEELNRLILNINQLSLHKSKQAAVDMFLLEIINILSHYSEMEISSAPSWLLKACEYIRSPLYFQEGISAFYRLCGKSPGHISRVILNLWQKTPTDIVNHARLEYAAMKLALSPVNVLDISIDCGFASLAYFYKVFKEHYNMTPRQYRLTRQSLVINFDETKQLRDIE